jgi:hypothetical protein
VPSVRIERRKLNEAESARRAPLSSCDVGVSKNTHGGHGCKFSFWVVEGAESEIVVCLLVGERVVREVSERAEPTIYPDPEGPARVIAGAVTEVG